MVERSLIECPRCGDGHAEAEGPGPGEGGLYALSCPACGYEEAGIADPGSTDLQIVHRIREPWDWPNEPLPQELLDAPTDRCEVCGKPGKIQNLPGGVPVSGCFCNEHVPAFVIKPLPILLILAAAFATLVVWLLL